MLSFCEADSAEISWKLNNWKATHALLAATASCRLDIGDIKLRFFLRPYEDHIEFRERPTTIEWYSLWAQLESPQEDENILLKITTKTIAWTAKYADCKEAEVKVVFQKDCAEPKEILVMKEFIRLRGWYHAVKSDGIKTMEITPEGLVYKNMAQQIRIDITATIMQAYAVPCT